MEGILCNIGSELPSGCALQTEEGNIPVSNIAFERAAREVRRATIFKQTVLNELIFHAAFVIRDVLFHSPSFLFMLLCHC